MEVYLGGNQGDHISDIAVDDSGNVYATGSTISTNFPIASPLQPAIAGNYDGFITKINAAGSALLYSTYLGGTSDDLSYGIAVDGAGNAFVTGQTTSTNFPTESPRQPAFGGGTYDGFAAKLNATGTALLYSTYLGGGGNDAANAIAVDVNGNAYITGYTGYTTSTNFPTAAPFQALYAGGLNDAFVSKLNASGSELLYSTYLGGTGSDYGSGIAVDVSGNAYVTGNTSSTNFPTANALQGVNNSLNSFDVFVTKLNAAGSALIYSTYHGGTYYESAEDIAVDASGNAYVVGETESMNMPTANALQPASGGQTDGFVLKLNPTGSAFIYSTYLGGSGGEDANSVAVDSAGNAYVTGATGSADFPMVNALRSIFAGGDAFVTKFNAAGSVLLYSTYLGGSNSDGGMAIAVDGSGNMYIGGGTNSIDFPTVNPLQSVPGGGFGGVDDAFVAKLSDTLPHRPTLSSIRPRSGCIGTTVTVALRGMYFATGSAGTTVAINGTGVTVGTVNVIDTTLLTVELTIAPTASFGWRIITVTTAGGKTIDGLPFRVKVLCLLSDDVD